MRTVGKRRTRSISQQANAGHLIEGATFNDQIHGLPTGNTTFVPKGLYRFSSHEEANAHWRDCVIAGMAEKARSVSE